MDGTGELFERFRALLPSHFTSCICPLRMQGDQQPNSLADSLAASYVPDEDIIIIAESFSGPIAYELYQRHTPQIKGIVFVSSFLTVPHPLLRLTSWLPLQLLPLHRIPQWGIRTFCVGRNAHDDLVLEISNVIKNVPTAIIAERIKVISRLAIPTEKIKIPCLYLQPTHDRLVPTWHAKMVRSLCENLTVQQISGPHFLLQANPEGCIGPVIEFVKLVTGAQLQANPIED